MVKTELLDVVALGSALVEFTPRRRHIRIGAATSYVKYPSGATLISVLCLSKLGVRVGLISKVGDDEFGEWILSVLDRMGVDTSYCKVADGCRTGLSFCQVYENGRKDYILYRFPEYSRPEFALTPEDIDPHYIKETRIFDFSEASVRLHPVREAAFKAVEIARECGKKVFYEVNLRRGAWVEKVERIREVQRQTIELADVILLNTEEAKFISNCNNLKDAVSRLLSFGPKVVTVTMGDKGCMVATTEERFEIPAYKVQVVYDVGAGDGFHAGFLAGYLSGWSIEKVGKFANATAAIKIMKPGMLSAFPTMSEVEDFMREA